MPTLREAQKGYYEGVKNLKAWYAAKGKIQGNTYNPKKGDLIYTRARRIKFIIRQQV